MFSLSYHVLILFNPLSASISISFSHLCLLSLQTRTHYFAVSHSDVSRMTLHPVSLFYAVVVITSTITVADPGDDYSKVISAACSNLELRLDVSTFSFTVPRTSPDVSDATGQYGLDHPSVVIDLPELECECTYSHGATTSDREQGGAASSSQAIACRENGEVKWVFLVRGLVPGFEYDTKCILSGHMLTHSSCNTPLEHRLHAQHKLLRSQVPA